MGQITKIYLSALITFIILDMTWLGVIAKNIYDKNIGSLMRRSLDGLAPNWYAALAVYLVFALGIMLFVLPKTNGSLLSALGWGALFGFIVYGVYDLTNLSILANWPLKITVIDLLWGTILCSLVSLIVTFIKNNI